MKLAVEGRSTQLLDLPGDLLQEIAKRASQDSHWRWVAPWHVCRRLRWLILFGEDSSEDGFSETQIRRLEEAGL